MSLKNFGNVLDFAIEIEQQDTAFLQGILQDRASESRQEEFKAWSKENTKNTKKLLRERQENVTEMILEPIQGLDEAAYTLDPSQIGGDPLHEAHAREQRAEAFYAEAAERLKPVSEVATTFRRLGTKHKARRERLEAE
ncbi:MAG: hypothetical protein ACQESV_08605 [Thermodesulfobacteriota bacterium]